jgi:hypothetical protein
MSDKIHIEANTVVETLVTPLYGRATCSKKFPDAFPDKVAEEIIDKIRAAIKAGNVDRILIRRNDEILVNIPVNLGLVGSAIALTAAPGALIAAAVAAYGFSCKIEIVRKDGSNEEL